MSDLYYSVEWWRPVPGYPEKRQPTSKGDPEITSARIMMGGTRFEIPRDNMELRTLEHRIEQAERIMLKAFDRGRAHQATLINNALSYKART